MQIFRGISFRLAKVGVVLALCVGILMSVVQISADYFVQRNQIESQALRLANMSLLFAKRAVTQENKIFAKEISHSFLNNEFISQIVIKNSLGDVLSSRQKAPEHSSTRWITRLVTNEFVVLEMPLRDLGVLPSSISATNVSEQEETGLLRFTIDIDTALKPFYQNALFVIAIGLIRSSILVFLLIFAYHLMLTKPLIRISRDMKKLVPGAKDGRRLALPSSRQDDELRQLVLSGNVWLDAVDNALDKRTSIEDVLRKSEENVRQIIDSLPVAVGARNSEGHYIFANTALAQFMNTTPEAMRGIHVSAFSNFFGPNVSTILSRDKKVIENKKSTEVWEEQWVDRDGNAHQMHTHIMPIEFYDDTVALVVSSDITELKATQALMEYMAYHDALTDLPNRSYLVERLEKELIQAAENHQYGALLFIDLDQFKNVNDSLGHPVGDSLLQHVSQRLSSSVAENDLVVRLGGDEFVVVLLDLGNDLSSAIFKVEETAERLRINVSQPYKHADIELHVTCSIGVVLFPEDDAGVHELLRYADTAMYHVKDQGRNAIQFFNKYMAETARDVLVMEGDLHKALDNKLFSLHYQPRVNSATAEVVGAEALLRWNHPENGMVSPAEFIPALETSGLIVDVGMWVLEEAIDEVQRWQTLGLWQTDMRMGVNISPRQFKSPNFVENVRYLLEDKSFDANMLEMEITEGVVIHNFDETVATMSSLRELGIRFALDDFGTGYSSISYLKQLPVSVLKIDQSFVRDITFDRNDRVLVETISAMGNMLELHVVAEGVETEEQLALLQQYGCDFYQGFLSSEPLDAQRFTGLLKLSEVCIA